MRNKPIWDSKGIARKDIHMSYEIYPESGRYYAKSFQEHLKDLSGLTAHDVASAVAQNIAGRGGGIAFKGPHTYELGTVNFPITAPGGDFDTEPYSIGLKGNGPNTVVRLRNNTNDSMFKQTGGYVEFAEVKDLYFDGNDDNNSSRADGLSALLELAAKSCWIHRNRFRKAFDYAVRLTSAGAGDIGFYNFIMHNHFRTMNVFAAVRVGSNDSNTVSMNTFGNVSTRQPTIGGVIWNGACIISTSGTLHADHNEMNFDTASPAECGAGIEFSGLHNWVTNNHIGGGGDIINGYKIHSPFRGTQFLGNSVTGSRKSGLHVIGDQVSTPGNSRFIIIAHNLLQNSGKANAGAIDEAGLALEDVVGANVEGNWFIDEQASPTMNNAIFEESGGADFSNHHLIKGNTVYKPTVNRFFRVDIRGGGADILGDNTYLTGNTGIYGTSANRIVHPIGYVGTTPFYTTSAGGRFVGPIQALRNIADAGGDAGKFSSGVTLAVTYKVVLTDIIVHANWLGAGTMAIRDQDGNEIGVFSGSADKAIYVPAGFYLKFDTLVPSSIRIHAVS